MNEKKCWRAILLFSDKTHYFAKINKTVIEDFVFGFTTPFLLITSIQLQLISRF